MFNKLLLPDKDRGILAVVELAPLIVKAIVAPFKEVDLALVQGYYEVHDRCLLEVLLEDGGARLDTVCHRSDRQVTLLEVFKFLV